MECGWPSYSELDEYEKLVMRMNPPRVTVDNKSSSNATLLKVDSANMHGSLLEVVQVLSDLKLTIQRAYISSDGEWFMDVFYVVDQNGNKLSDGEVINRIEQSLGARAYNLRSVRRSVDVQPAAKNTSIELIGRDRPGLLSDIFAVLTDLGCNIVASEMWTHNSRMASVIYITDESTGSPIDDPDRLAKIKQLLRYVLKGDRDMKSPKTSISTTPTHIERRLHQMLSADRDFQYFSGEMAGNGVVNPVVSVEDWNEKGYSVVSVKCKDRPKIIFDTVCTLADMQYVVFHGTVIAEGPEAYQEYFIRHIDGSPLSSEGERQRLITCIQAAIRRRATEGLRLELCGDDRVGLLSEVTRIFRENGLSVTQAEVKTRESQAADVFYVVDASGEQVQNQTIEDIRREISEKFLDVKGDLDSKSSSASDSSKFSLGSIFRSRSEKFLLNLGLIIRSSP